MKLTNGYVGLVLFSAFMPEETVSVGGARVGHAAPVVVNETMMPPDSYRWSLNRVDGGSALDKKSTK